MADLWRVTYMGDGVKPTEMGAFAKYTTAFVSEEFARSVAGQGDWIVADPSGSELGSRPAPKAEPKPEPKKAEEKKHAEKAEDKKPAEKAEDKKPAEKAEDKKHDDKKAEKPEEKKAEKAEKK